jgi:hypothetical protein
MDDRQKIHWGECPTRNALYMMLWTDITQIDSNGVDCEEEVDNFMAVYQLDRKQFDEFKDYE